MKKNRFDEKFKNMPIKKKLVTSFGVVIVTTFLSLTSSIPGNTSTDPKKSKKTRKPSENSAAADDP